MDASNELVFPAAKISTKGGPCAKHHQNFQIPPNFSILASHPTLTTTHSTYSVQDSASSPTLTWNPKMGLAAPKK